MKCNLESFQNKLWQNFMLHVISSFFVFMSKSIEYLIYEFWLKDFEVCGV